MELLWLLLPCFSVGIMFGICSFFSFFLQTLCLCGKKQPENPRCKKDCNKEEAPEVTKAWQRQQADERLKDSALHSALIPRILRRLAVKDPGNMRPVCEWRAAFSIYSHFSSFPYISTKITILEGEGEQKKAPRIISGKESQVPIFALYPNEMQLFKCKC